MLSESALECMGAGTVRMGRCVIEEMGGEPAVPESRRDGGLSAAFSSWDVGCSCGFGAVLGTPLMVGGGSSSPSFAFRDSWRAKSEACHHSRNLRAKMDVGRSMRRLESKRGYTVCVIIRGLNIEFVWPGLTPGLVVASEDAGCIATAIALLSASLSRRMRVPIIQRNGEWYFEPSNR